MDILLKTYKQLKNEDYKELWEKGTFIFDTNVILDLYRLPESAKNDLLKILDDKKLNDRIWMPFQVFLEYSQNRITVINSQKNAFNEVENILNTAINSIKSSFKKIKTELDRMELDKRHSLINPENYYDENLLDQPIKSIEDKIKELKELEKKQPDIINFDNLQIKIIEIFSGKIGTSFSSDELKEIYKEGEQRFDVNTPPGYKDHKKITTNSAVEIDDFYLFEDKKILKKYGDLLFWKEILRKAKAENLEYVVLVTNEKKEGWLKEKNGKTLGVAYELLNEIYFNATSVKLFYIYSSPNFMKFAKQYLKIDITDESIEETKDLLTLNQLLNQQLYIPKKFQFAENALFKWYEDAFLTSSINYKKHDHGIDIIVTLMDGKTIGVQTKKGDLYSYEKTKKNIYKYVAHNFSSLILNDYDEIHIVYLFDHNPFHPILNLKRYDLTDLLSLSDSKFKLIAGWINQDNSFEISEISTFHSEI